MERPKSVAKWGAACSACASAKAKCLRSNDNAGAKCDRCERLFKDCTNQVHKPRKKRTSKPSKTAQLEQRLNGLVDLLRASGELRGVDPGGFDGQNAREAVDKISCIAQDIDLDIGVSLASRAQSSPQDDSSDDEEEDELAEEGSIRVPKHYNSYAPPTCICCVEPGLAPGPPETDETILTVYQTHLSPLFPFVIIPPGTTPEELETSRPFLFSAIRMVTTLTNMRSMHAQMYKLIAQVSDRMLIRSEKSLDLLQGIIVMVGWHHYHCLMHSQMNNLIHLAQSLAADLGLNRHPSIQERTSLMVLYPDDPPPRSNEERRAMLGVWYMTSCMATGFYRIQSLNFTPYIKLCLQELQDNREYETDIILAHMVRIQNLTEKIVEMRTREQEDSSVLRAPISAYTSTYQAELDKIQSSISKNLKNNKYLMVYVHSTVLRLYEPPTVDSALLNKFHKDLTSLSDSTPSSLDLFYRASHALQAWYDHWFTVPISSYFYLPMPVIVQIIYSTTMLARWAKLVSPVPRNPGPRIGGAAGIVDPSANNPQCRPAVPIPVSLRQRIQQGSRHCMGLAPPPNFDEAGGEQPAVSASTVSNSPSASVGSTAPSETSADPLVKPLSDVKFRETTDPSIPVIVAAMKEQLNAQLGLKIDITGILSQFASRCAQANEEMLLVGGGEAERNVWDLASKKINITRAKLERWAEIIAQGGPETYPPAMPGDNMKTKLGYERGRYDDCMPCHPTSAGEKTVLPELDQGASEAAQQQQQQQEQQQPLENQYMVDGGMVNMEMAPMEDYGTAMNLEPNVIAHALNSGCADFWFQNGAETSEQNLWDNMMMDWGPINIF
ncbi:hypothetical protein GQ53DRAFT_753570 [Thozetella sp. PMI_491]|nr:hypothetical protein GQ53DRAFT_753570 [Thozetella sp. PMI_491]